MFVSFTADSIVTFNGVMTVNLIGINTVLRKVDLIGVVGTVSLVLNPAVNKLQLTQGNYVLYVT